MRNLFNKVFKRKKNAQIPKADALLTDKYFIDAFKGLEQEQKENLLKFSSFEPITNAKVRLEGGSQDVGYLKAIKLYNSHKTKMQNQWINPLQAINSGYGTAQYSFYNFQTVNYYECFILSQDPLFNNIFDILSKTPLSKGGKLVTEKTSQEVDDIEKVAVKYKVNEHISKALRSNAVSGGCLIYMDFGLNDLEKPLDLKTINCKRFKGFRHIDPINCVAVNVNTINPADGNYMEPDKWYVIGLGIVHKSHFLKFEDNVPELMLKPLTLYFGMPLVQLIKQDVANSNLASQGLANLINRFRYIYLKTAPENFTTNCAGLFKQRLEVMSGIQNNFSVYPIKNDEEVIQLTTPLTGLSESCEFFYQIVSAKTGIPLTKLIGKNVSGLNNSGHGDRLNFNDKIKDIQQNIKSNLLIMYGICSGVINGTFEIFEDYKFNPIDESLPREKSENIRSYVDTANALLELGVKQDGIIDWLKSIDDLNLQNLDFDLIDSDELEGYEENPLNYKTENQFKESEHPRDRDGKFTESDSNDGDKNNINKILSYFKNNSKINIEKLKFDDLPERTYGDFNILTGEIRLNKNIPERLIISTIIHEYGHLLTIKSDTKIEYEKRKKDIENDFKKSGGSRLSPSFYGCKNGEECLAEIYLAWYNKDSKLKKSMINFFNRWSSERID